MKKPEALFLLFVVACPIFLVLLKGFADSPMMNYRPEPPRSYYAPPPPVAAATGHAPAPVSVYVGGRDDGAILREIEQARFEAQMADWDARIRDQRAASDARERALQDAIWSPRR